MKKYGKILRRLGYVLFVVFIIFPIKLSYAWTLNANFEEGKLGDKAHGLSGFSEAGSLTVFSADNSAAGKKSAQIKWLAGNDGWGKSHGSLIYPQKVSEGGEIWARGYFFFKSPWSFKASPFAKLLRIHIEDSLGKHIGYHSIIFDSDRNIVVSNEVRDFQPTSSAKLDADSWQCLEIYVNLSSSAGIMRIWKNGELAFEDTQRNTLKNSTDFADFSYIMTYWNGGAPQDQTEYVDELVITTDTPAQKDKNGNPMIGPAKP